MQPAPIRHRPCRSPAGFLPRRRRRRSGDGGCPYRRKSAPRCARHSVAKRAEPIGIVLEQSHHHADRLLVLDGDAANGIERIEEAGVLDQDQGAFIAIGQSGGDADAFILLANTNEPQVCISRDRRQQPGTCGDIGHRQDVFDRACLDRGDDAAAVQQPTRLGSSTMAPSSAPKICPSVDRRSSAKSRHERPAFLSSDLRALFVVPRRLRRRAVRPGSEAT